MYANVQFVSPARVLTAVKMSCLVQCIFVLLQLLYLPSLTMLIYEVTVTWTDRSCPGAYLRQVLASGPSSYRPLAAPHLSELCLRWRPFLTFLHWAYVADFNHYRDLQPSLQITWYLYPFLQLWMCLRPMAYIECSEDGHMFPQGLSTSSSHI